MPVFPLQIIFNPATSSQTSRQVLLSNCMNLDLGGPTFDLSLENGEVVLRVVTDQVIKTGSNVIVPVTLAMPYTVGFSL